MGQLPLANTAYLKRRRGKGRSGYRWYVRINVPPDLQRALRARTIERALNTSDLKEASRRKHTVLADIFASFERARRQVITSSDIEHEAQRFLKEQLTSIRERPGDVYAELANEFDANLGLAGDGVLVDLYDALGGESWPPDIAEEAIKIGARYGVELTKSQRSELCRALLRAQIEALSRALAIHKGESITPLAVLNSRAVDPITAAVKQEEVVARRSGKGLRIHEAAEEYLKSRNRERDRKWTGQTQGQARATFRLFEDFARNAPIETITRRDVADFLSTLSRLNKNYGRQSASKKMSLSKLIEHFPAEDGRGLTSKTLRRHATVLGGMFDWAIASGTFTTENPVHVQSRALARVSKDTEPTRRIFSTNELNRLFRGPLYSASPADFTAPNDHTVDSALAWLIPIALFSGMRLDEMCGLRVKDVGEEDGIWRFDLRSYEGRRLKTAAARRRIPLHSQLRELGFFKYVAHLSDHKQEFLFPALKAGGPDKKRSWYVSKRFTAYRRSVGVSAAETVFHCFRKNAATALERARVPENEAVQILGHKKMTMSYGLYSGGLDLAGLARVIEAIAYPELILPYLANREVRGDREQMGRQPSLGTASSLDALTSVPRS